MTAIGSSSVRVSDMAQSVPRVLAQNTHQLLPSREESVIAGAPPPSPQTTQKSRPHGGIVTTHSPRHPVPRAAYSTRTRTTSPYDTDVNDCANAGEPGVYDNHRREAAS